MAKKSRRTLKKPSQSPELQQLMEQMRNEIARELGLPSDSAGQFGDVSSKLCGTYGQILYKRAAELLEGRGE